MPQSGRGNSLTHIDIENLLRGIRTSFISELPHRLDSMESLVLGMRSGGNSSEDYQELYRHVHSLKGSAGTHNLHIISTICHKFEDYLSLFQNKGNKPDKDQIDIWLAFIDLIRRSVHAVNATGQDLTKIEQDLQQLWVTSTSKYHGLMVAMSQLHRGICLGAFENYPISFSYAENGYDALGLLLGSKYDILITGVETPKLPGTALITAIRMSASASKDVKIILLTTKHALNNKRQSDPNYVLLKDNSLPNNLAQAAADIFSSMPAYK